MLKSSLACYRTHCHIKTRFQLTCPQSSLLAKRGRRARIDAAAWPRGARGVIFTPGYTVQLCAQQDFFGVSHDAICCAQRRKSRLNSNSATVARNVAKKVASCVRVFPFLFLLSTTPPAPFGRASLVLRLSARVPRVLPRETTGDKSEITGNRSNDSFNCPPKCYTIAPNHYQITIVLMVTGVLSRLKVT